MTDQPLINRVANSGLVTLKLEAFFPTQELVHFDLKDYLFMELILKEKDFRTALKEHDWSQYDGKVLLVYCSADAIIPLWAYMLVAAHATPHAADIYQGQEADYIQYHFLQQLDQLDLEQYRDQRVVVKGCSDREVPAAAYLDITKRLRMVAKKVMFGEPCSTVMVWRGEVKK